MSNRNQPTAHRRGFTLVEVLTVIIIISILAAMATVGIGRVRESARTTAIRMEINSIDDAISQYQQKYGDYPPDFSSWAVVTRHYRKIFPRISDNDQQLLYNMLHDGAGVFQAARLDRAEALVFALGGYSEDPQRPFTGPGGPFAWVGAGDYDAAMPVEKRNPNNFQINNDRVNRLHDFEQGRLNFTEIDPSALMTGANRYLSTDDDDLFLTYAASADGAPFVYFDSRTYDQYDTNIMDANGALGDFNGYGSTDYGQVRPYLSDRAVANSTAANYASESAALAAWQFVNDDTFQVLSAGLDNNFGSTTTAGTTPIYFQYPTGKAIVLRTDRDTPGKLVHPNVSGYQEQTAFGAEENFQPDNVTNFSKAKIADDVSDQE